MPARLPIPGEDAGTWGDILNEFLEVSHNPDGSLRNINLDLISNVDVSGVDNGFTLVYDAATSTWLADKAAAGALGGGDDEVFYENDTVITTNYTITTNKNAMTAGPVTLNTGVEVTVPSGSVWTVV
ncbi:MAG: hypothetical protein WD061_01630 [Candidatus Saccharimonadales bacterium]